VRPVAFLFAQHRPQFHGLEILGQTNALIDVYAAAVAYSGKYGAAVKPEDVKTLLTTVFINLSKGGAHAA
jgi:hypothetical protein